MASEPRTIAALAGALRTREITSVAATQQCLDAIAAKNQALNAFITVLADEALAQARAADAELASGRDRGPLHGVPISLKDLMDLRGTATTAASRVREPRVASRDAAVVSRLRDAGAVFVGKTNLHEFALGTTNEDSAYGPARHPLDPGRSPGGSSGGSAVSVAAAMAFGSVGTDTGGSIRIPAAACGLVGLKPAFHDVPTDGVIPLSMTMDHVGPLARTVEDAEMLFNVMRRTSGVTNAAPIGEPALITLGVLRGYFTAVLDRHVAAAFDALCARLQERGVVLEDADIAHTGDISPIYVHIGLSEAAAFHARTLDSRPDQYTPNVRLRLEMGRYILAEDYLRALRGRDILTDQVNRALERRHALLLPSLPIPAFKLGTESIRVGPTEEPIRNLTLRLTQLFNLTGHPAISIPCGATPEGLPVGAQLVGATGDTSGLLRLARQLEPAFH
jgi:aspartyl-tRNA(Asn)/glutamyl-tRNA(Gln) amidotransferase subunit A